jgi:hypothetical protein
MNRTFSIRQMERSMKQYAFLTLTFFAMVMAILLSSCGTAAGIPPVASEQQVVSPTLAAPLPEQPVVVEPSPTAAPTSQPVLVIPVTAVTQPPATLDAEVTANVLNVRVGPGMNHRIMAQLPAGQIVRMEGRSQTGEWIAVRLADGKEGWVYRSYLSTSADLTALPVMEAYGGPLAPNPEVKPPAKPARRYTLDVSISDSLAEVRMAGFAGDQAITLRLAVPGEGLAMTVASTTTGAEGSAGLTFAMPAFWPAGSAVSQSEMELQVIGSDGLMQGKAKIYYQSGN